LEPDFDPERVAGRILFLGTSAAGLLDLRATPLEAAMPGVEVHAQVIEQIVTGDYLDRPDFIDGVEITYMLLLGIGLILLLPRIGAVWSGALGAAAVGGVLAASWIAYDRFGWLVDPVYPSIAVFLVFLFETVIVYLRSETERRQVRGAFSRYMSPALVEQLADHPERLTLGGEMRDMTLLFCDIRGFTTISEQFDAGGLTKFINRFLTPMTNIILETSGTIDKYMGDCIMAFWNAPLDDADHADHACRAALAMMTKLEELNRDWRAAAESEGRKHIPVNVGVGLNTGLCCVGNMGSDQRFDYSVLGDAVNLASRLEGETKSYLVDIILGENTEKLVPHLAALELDTVQVKGKTYPVRIFALLGDEKLAATAEFAELKARNQERLAALPGGDGKSMREAIAACRGLAGGKLDSFYDSCEARLGAD
jgi:adenylate cyclase